MMIVIPIHLPLFPSQQLPFIGEDLNIGYHLSKKCFLFEKHFLILRKKIELNFGFH
jgi:hypothetical protein